MKTFVTSLLLVTAIPLLDFDTSATELPADTNLFAIYLVASQVDSRLTANGIGNWTNLSLLRAPIITERNLDAYEWKTHTLRLKSGMTPASLGRVPVQGIPFVVVARGEKIYLGTFVTAFSSMSFDVPAIMADPLGGDLNTMVINSGYPGASSANRLDPRNDERIRVALKAAGKLDRQLPKPEKVMETDPSQFLHLTVTTNDTVRVEKPGVGTALVRFIEFGKRSAKFAWRFKSTQGGQATSGEGSVDEITPGHAVMQAGDIRLEWSDGGASKGYVYYHPYRENAELFGREVFDQEL
jgi:hypothetical protein